MAFGKEPSDGLPDPQLPPEGAKHIGAAQGAGLGEGEVGEGGDKRFRLVGVQIPTDGADQTFKRVPGLGVLPAEVV